MGSERLETVDLVGEGASSKRRSPIELEQSGSGGDQRQQEPRRGARKLRMKGRFAAWWSTEAFDRHPPMFLVDFDTNAEALQGIDHGFGVVCEEHSGEFAGALRRRRAEQSTIRVTLRSRHPRVGIDWLSER